MDFSQYNEKIWQVVISYVKNQILGDGDFYGEHLTF